MFYCCMWRTHWITFASDKIHFLQMESRWRVKGSSCIRFANMMELFENQNHKIEETSCQKVDITRISVRPIPQTDSDSRILPIPSPIPIPIPKYSISYVQLFFCSFVLKEHRNLVKKFMKKVPAWVPTGYYGCLLVDLWNFQPILEKSLVLVLNQEEIPSVSFLLS